MNMKKSIKIVATLLLAIMLVSTISTTCLAGSVGNVTIGAGTDKMTDGMKGKLANIIKTLRNLSLIIAVIVLVILGIKYMLGSVEEKAEYKKSFMPLVVGIVVIAAVFQIADFIYKFAA